MNLLEYRKSVTSQFGEDGILEKINEVLGIHRGFCVEFGAWDGKENSNTFHLLNNRQWGGVLIEANPERYIQLQALYKTRNDVVTINSRVEFDGTTTLDTILKQVDAPPDIHFISIDVDGNDYHLFDSIHHYLPMVIVVEFNPTIPNAVGFVQACDSSVNQGSSLRAIDALARRKGYQLVCCTEVNAFFVKNQLFPLFGIEDNSIDALHTDTKYHTYLFQLYDGTIRIAGVDHLLWSGVKIDERKMQMIPADKRRYGDACEQ